METAAYLLPNVPTARASVGVDFMVDEDEFLVKLDIRLVDHGRMLVKGIHCSARGGKRADRRRTG